jgi:large subunit ribosomal protein L30
MSEKTLKVTLVKSVIGYTERQKRTVRALGLRKLNQSVLQADRPEVRGMIAKVAHLVRVEEVENDETA